jgi:hypothetical protein
VIALGDPRFGQHGAAFANAVRRFVVRSPGNDRVGQIGDGSFKFLVRDGVIPRPQGGFAPGKRGFALWYGSLTPLHFAVGNVFGVLRERGSASEQTDRSESSGERTRPRVLAMAASPSRTSSGFTGIRCNGYCVLGDFHKSHFFLFRIVIWGLAGPLQRFNFLTLQRRRSRLALTRLY